MKKRFFIVLALSMFALSVLFSEDGYVSYAGVGDTSNTAVLNVSFSSNGNILSVGFSSTDPSTTKTPVSVINLSSNTGFDSNGHRTLTGNVTFYPYWQIQKNSSLKVVISRSENLTYLGRILSYTSKLKDSSTELKATEELDLYTYGTEDYNKLVSGSVGVTINTSDASSFPYGASFSGTITLKVIAI